MLNILNVTRRDLFEMSDEEISKLNKDLVVYLGTEHSRDARRVNDMIHDEKIRRSKIYYR